MRICIDARMLRASGIGTYLQNLLPALAQQHTLMLIGNPRELTAYQTEIIATDISIYSVQELFKFPFLIPACDIFWSPHYNVPLLPIKAKKRLVTIHDVYHLAYFQTLSLKQKLYAKVSMQAAIRMSQCIITVSEFSKKEIIKYTGSPPDKISVIHNGVHHDHFRVIEDKSVLQIVKEKYQLPEYFILFVGNVKPHKNLISLINAFDKVKSQIPDHNLVIVGKKEGFITNDNEVFSRITQDETLAGRIHFTGYVADEDLPAIYNLADLFVFPSLYEGFGLPPLEAMACGCPVLVSDKACMPEICGLDTYYIDPVNVEQMATDIQKVLRHTKAQTEEMIEKGLRQAACYTWQKSIQAHLELIHNL